MKPALLLWLALYPWFIAPGCAALAGLLTWTYTRRKSPADTELLRHFLVFMALLLIASYLLISREAVIERLVPAIKLRRELHAMPVHAALREHLPSRWETMERQIEQGLAAGQPMPELVSQLRARYVPLARELLPFAEGPAVLAYGRALVPALQELRGANAPLCVQLAWPRAGGTPLDAGARLGAPIYGAYEAAVVRLVEMNGLSVARGTRQQPDPAFQSSLKEMQSAYAAIRQDMEARYGPVVTRLNTAAVTTMEPKLACAATIELLSRALRERPGVARSLLTNLLRT